MNFIATTGDCLAPNSSKMIVRAANYADVKAMTRIYAHHVLDGTGSFEETPPSEQDIEERFRLRDEKSMPTLVAEIDGKIGGFAYASLYKERSAYRFTAEDSVYVDHRYQRLGVGKALLNEIINACRTAGYRQLIGVVGDSENKGSIQLHKSCGFRQIGIGHDLGYKHGRWLNIVFMQLNLHSES